MQDSDIMKFGFHHFKGTVEDNLEAEKTGRVNEDLN